MVKHARQLVREAAVADLTGLATTGANVFTSRVQPLQETEMPGMFVMLRDERGDLEGQALGMVARNGNLVIEAWAQGGDGLEDLLDTIGAEVEAAIYGAEGIAEVAVFGVPDERLGEVPIAILHRREGSIISEEDLRTFLGHHISAFKIPVRFIFAEQPLPRLGTGKIDRVALKQQYTG